MSPWSVNHYPKLCYFYGARDHHHNEIDEYSSHSPVYNSAEDAMVYDWEGKEATCFQMYIQENQSLEEIMEYFKVEHNFAPRYVTSWNGCQ